MEHLPYALQLFTIRDHMAQDAAETLKRVKQIGYDNVEVAGMAGLGAADFRRLLDDNGLTAVSAHYGLDAFAGEINRVIEECQTLDLKHVVMPAANADSEEGWVDIAQTLDQAGAELRRESIQLSYHNHAREFDSMGGRTIFDIIFSNSAEENLTAQIDTFWAYHAGVDPAALIRQYAGRCPLLHIKDAAPQGQEPIFADLGTGTMDLQAVLEAGKEVGAQWYIVEQDQCAGDSLESARIGAEFMARQQV
jgi:sugar phosphate isomerase/epimerase